MNLNKNTFSSRYDNLWVLPALIFNPFVPLRMSKELWIIIDLVLVFVYLVNTIGLDMLKSKTSSFLNSVKAICRPCAYYLGGFKFWGTRIFGPFMLLALIPSLSKQNNLLSLILAILMVICSLTQLLYLYKPKLFFIYPVAYFGILLFSLLFSEFTSATGIAHVFSEVISACFVYYYVKNAYTPDGNKKSTKSNFSYTESINSYAFDHECSELPPPIPTI